MWVVQKWTEKKRAVKGSVEVVNSYIVLAMNYNLTPGQIGAYFFWEGGGLLDFTGSANLDASLLPTPSILRFCDSVSDDK